MGDTIITFLGHFYVCLLKRKVFSGQFSNVIINQQINKKNFIAPDATELEEMEKIVRCSCDYNSDGGCSYEELVSSNKPVFVS